MRSLGINKIGMQFYGNIILKLLNSCHVKYSYDIVLWVNNNYKISVAVSSGGNNF